MILVKFETSAQITHDEWRTYWIEKVFSEFTTLNEIIEWAKEKQNTNKAKDFRLDLGGLIITEIES
jgi:hypothetical protein